MFEKVKDTVVEISQERVIWEKCFREQICINIPFDGKKCATAEACIRIVESGGRFYIEIQLFGSKVRYELANTCFPAYTIGIARLEVCASVGRDSVCIGAKLCIGALGLQKCWKVYEGCVRFLQAADLTDDKSIPLGSDLVADAKIAGANHLYVDYLQTESVPVPPDFDLKAAMARYRAT